MSDSDEVDDLLEQLVIEKNCFLCVLTKWRNE